MADLALIRGFDPIFRKTAAPVEQFDEDLRETVDALYALLYAAGGIGLGAPMAGLLRRIAIVDLQPGGVRAPLTLINPDIVSISDTVQTHEEASLCFPGISAAVTRPAAIRVRFQDVHGTRRERDAEGWLAQVIQHELDYLDGILFPDRLSRLKRDQLTRKMRKIK